MLSIHTFIDTCIPGVLCKPLYARTKKYILPITSAMNLQTENISIGVKCMIKNTKAQLKFEHTFMLICVCVCGKFEY